MKKTLLAVLVCGLLMIGAVGSAFATTFTSVTDLDKLLSGTGTFSWTQAMPSDFQMPYDTINSAKLTIYSNFVDGNNDKITVQNTYEGKLKNDTGWTWLWNPMEATKFNIASAITEPWATGQDLNVTLAYNEKGCLNFLYLDEAVLCLNYDNNSAPVPEPGTMVLFGIGMAGLAIYSKRRRNA